MKANYQVKTQTSRILVHRNNKLAFRPVVLCSVISVGPLSIGLLSYTSGATRLALLSVLCSWFRGSEPYSPGAGAARSLFNVKLDVDKSRFRLSRTCRRRDVTWPIFVDTSWRRRRRMRRGGRHFADCHLISTQNCIASAQTCWPSDTTRDMTNARSSISHAINVIVIDRQPVSPLTRTLSPVFAVQFSTAKVAAACRPMSADRRRTNRVICNRTTSDQKADKSANVEPISSSYDLCCRLTPVAWIVQ